MEKAINEEHIVYKVRAQDETIYVGFCKASQWTTRVSRHKKGALQLEHFTASQLTMAIHGVDALEFDIVKRFEDRPTAHRYEVDLIRELQPPGNTYSKK